MSAGLPALPGSTDFIRQLADALADDDDGPELRDTLMTDSAGMRGQDGSSAAGGGQALPFAPGPDTADVRVRARKATERFLKLLDPNASRFDFRAIDDRKGRGLPTKLFTNKTLAEAWPELWRLNQLGYGIFVMVNATDNRGQKGANVIRVRSVIADCDGVDPSKLVAAKTPHMAISTSPSKYHLYWLDSDCPLDLFTPLHKALIAKYGTDKAVHDLPRVLRLPGFYHHKAEPYPVSFDYGLVPKANMDLPPYTAREIIDGLEIDVDPAAPRSSATGDASRRKAPAGAEATVGLPGAGTLSPFDFGLQAGRDATTKLPPPPATSEWVEWVRGALDAIGPDCIYVVWMEAAFAVLATLWACAPDLLREWSQKGEKWKANPELANAQLEDFIKRYDPNRPVGIGFGKLIFLAKDAKYTVPRPGAGSAGLAGGGQLAEAGQTAVGDASAAIDKGGDVATGRLFAEIHRGKLLFVVEDSEGSPCLILDPVVGWRYVPDAAARAAKAVSDAMFADAMAKVRAGGLSKEERQKLFAFVERASRLPQQRAMIELARSEPGMWAAVATLDADPMQLGHLGGVLDLRTGRPVPITPAVLVTKRCGVAFDPAVTCPTWDRFVARIFPDPEKLAFVQRLAGYLLTGWTREQQFVFAQGGGQNGKSTFFEVLAFVLGGYAVKLPTEVLMQSRQPRNPQGPSADVMALKGARMAYTGETEEGQRLATARIKEWSGDGELTGRAPYGKSVVTFTITHKLVFVGNAKVAIPDTGPAMARRFIFLTFDATIPKAERDKGLKEKLEREGTGVLNWMLDGLRDYLAGGGLRVPASMRDAARDYLKAEDTFGTFLADSFEAGPTFTVSKAVLRACYEEWCKENGHPPLGQTALTRKLNERGHSLDRNTRTFSGIRRPPVISPASRA